MQTYTICDGRGTQAVILPEKGATAISFTHQGEEFLYCDGDNLRSPERPRCGIPFLFPIFGRLKDGMYQWEGKTYAMEIHGFGHTSPWQVAEQTGDSLVCVLETSEATLAQYPFRFRVTLRFQVADGVLTIGQRYENLDEKPLPYHFGFHPYFRVEKLENASVEANAQVYIDFAKGPAPFGHGSVSMNLPEGAPEAGAAFAQATSPAILHIPQEGRRVTMEFDDSFHQLVLWTLAGKPFLCVEPINGSPDALNTGAYMTLAPGGVRETTLSIRAERI